MPEVQLKQLYMATSLELLNQKVTINKAKPKLLVNSARKVLSKAELSDKEKDEELAYIYFMKYFGIIRSIKTDEEYRKNKKYYDSLLDCKNSNKIILRAEELSNSLQRRYKLLADSKLQKKREEKKESQKVEEKESKKYEKINFTNTKSAISEDGFISCEKLVSLMKEKVSSYLIIDVRSKKDFKNSFMKISTLINIPEDILKPGLTANKIGKELDENSSLLWSRRDSYDYLIICDMLTDAPPLPAPIVVLSDVIENWDPGKNYRATPAILRGGFEMFCHMYPYHISNPKPEIGGKYSFDITKTKSDSSLNFDFPDLNSAFLVTPSPEKKIDYPKLSEEIKPPSVYRNLKPKVFLPQTVPLKEEPFDSTPTTSTGMASDSQLKMSNTNSMGGSQLFAMQNDDIGTSSALCSVNGEEVIENGTSKIVPSGSEKIGTSHPSIPSRGLKPQELLESLKNKTKDLEEENLLLEQSVRAEKDTLEKLKEVEAMRKIKEETMDENILLKLSNEQSCLQKELKDKQELVHEMERKYSVLHKQNEDLINLCRYFSAQLKIDANLPTGSPDHNNAHQMDQNEAFMMEEDKRKRLLLEVEEMRRRRKEKEREYLEEEEMRKKQRAKLKEKEDKRNQQRKRPETSSRQSDHVAPSEFHGSKTTPVKRVGAETYTTKLKTSPRTSPVRGLSNIKRSHSALNLSQLEDDSSFHSSFSGPVCDRSLKPLNLSRQRNLNAARQRNFEPKYGSVGPTKTGLKNLGNTCYMNSIIQCLSNTFPLAKYFFEGLYSDDLNPKSNQRGEVAEEVGAVVRALWCGQYRSIAMWDLKSVVGRYHRPFQGYDQHDSHEFLIKLMDWLHDDLNLVSVKLSKMEEQNFENIPDYVAAQNVMDALQERDESIICNLFHGLHRSVIVCHTCSHRSLTFEPFSVLTVSFPSNGRCSLKDLLYDFYKETRIEYKCSKCHKMRNCTRKFDIWKLPPILIIHLNRFEHDVLTKKKQNFVDFPLDGLNLAEYTAGPNRFNSYDLYGVSNHYGTIDGGHYTAFCRSPQKSWYKFDDHEVYDLSRNLVKTPAAYMLFYECVH